MELLFLAILVLLMAMALGSGFPVAFALPGSAILTISLAAVSGYFFGGGVDAFFHSGGPSQWLTAGVTNLRGVYWEVERDTLIAIPLFIFMGIMLQRSKIAEDLLVTMARLFGPVPGGLGISVVFVGALLAATTGIVGATVVAMGLISLPAMLRNNYSQPLATGTIAASGTLGQIIPPSIVLIILADQLASAADQASTLRKVLYKEATGEITMPGIFDVGSTSAGEMFLGAFVPGILLVLIYMVYILIFAILRPKSAPAVHYEGTWDARFWGSVLLTLVPPLALIFLVLGSIISGIATVNQAGAIGAAGALIMAGYRLPEDRPITYAPAILALLSLALIGFSLSTYTMNVKAIMVNGGDPTGIYLGVLATVMLMISLCWSGLRVFRIDDTLRGVMVETAKTTSLVFIILLGAAMLTAAFRAFGGEDLVREFLNSLPGGFWSQFVIVMAVIFFLGFFLDFIEIAVVVVPIVAPILMSDPQANITAVWLGVMIGLNIQTSFLTPPFGFALFYLRGVAPAVVKTVQIYKGVVAFILLQLVALAIVGYYPPLVNYLPNRVSLLGETAPPPRNPKMQVCLEEYVRDKVAEDGATIGAAISAAGELDLSALPKKMSGDLSKAFQSGETALTSLDAIFVAEAAVTAAVSDYRPNLRIVRNLQKEMRKLEAQAENLRKTVRFLRNAEDTTRRDGLEVRIAGLEAQRDALEAKIPDTWAEQNKVFKTLVATEEKARNTYRRAADDAVEAPAEFLLLVRANEAFFALQGELAAMEQVIATADPTAAETAFKDLESKFGDLAGGGDIRNALSKARRSMRERSLDREQAAKDFATAVAAYDAQIEWRRAADGKPSAGVQVYLEAVNDTIGARQLPRLTREQALNIATCSASHRDISLNF